MRCEKDIILLSLIFIDCHRPNDLRLTDANLTLESYASRVNSKNLYPRREVQGCVQPYKTTMQTSGRIASLLFSETSNDDTVSSSSSSWSGKFPDRLWSLLEGAQWNRGILAHNNSPQSSLAFFHEFLSRSSTSFSLVLRKRERIRVNIVARITTLSSFWISKKRIFEFLKTVKDAQITREARSPS